MSDTIQDEDENIPVVYLLEWRNALQLTQTQLGDRMGRHHTHVLNSEKTKRGMTLEKLCEFANGLGIPWQLLLRSPPRNLEDLVSRLSRSDVEKLIAIIAEVAEPHSP